MVSDLAAFGKWISEWSNRLVDLFYADHFESFILRESPLHWQKVESFRIGLVPITNGHNTFVKATGKSLAMGSGQDHPPSE